MAFSAATETLNELTKIRAFSQQPTIDSITQGLYEKGLLIPDPDGKHLKRRMRFNGGNPRGWYIVFPSKNGAFPQGGNSKTDSGGSSVPTSTVPTGKERKKFF